eukprot:CAMPEP_0174912184 /NCGR_PEP_ID=MMETSP0167-20121228/79646_1 /TAXON_ID=38298 /ORGANISM="Rhodella maculata, Strain CCMP736" /LENGTH=106 /DNA_ID=CAMNT_0016156829 /DNA_START=280 /DNA_END=600 /DNA_ORIENTATION=+
MTSTPDIPSAPESSAHRVLHRVPHRGIKATATLFARDRVVNTRSPSPRNGTQDQRRVSGRMVRWRARCPGDLGGLVFFSKVESDMGSVRSKNAFVLLFSSAPAGAV